MSIAKLSLPKSNWKQNKAIRRARSGLRSVQQTGSLKEKKETEQLEEDWETHVLMSNILQHHKLCHTPLLIAPTWAEEQFSNPDEEGDIILSLKSLTVDITKQ